ncbi:MAG: hypothetical protein K2X82_02620 [Gemmataceae bacterium]|nr:hypothetical protein [Gemmataceae bacterium]
MPIMSQPAFGPKLSIGFITGGALFIVWTLVWRYTIKSGQDLTPNEQFFFYGVLLTGATILTIGAFLGSIGRAARKVELPPTDETTRAEANVQAGAAANPNPGVAGAVMAPGMAGVAPAAAGMPVAPVPAAPPAPPAGTAPAYRR